MPPFYRGLDGYTFTENKYNIVMAIFFCFLPYASALCCPDMKKRPSQPLRAAADMVRMPVEYWRRKSALLDLASVAQGVRYGQLVDILQFVAEAYAAGNGRNLDVGVLSQAVHYIE